MSKCESCGTEIHWYANLCMDCAVEHNQRVDQWVMEQVWNRHWKDWVTHRVHGKPSNGDRRRVTSDK